MPESHPSVKENLMVFQCASCNKYRFPYTEFCHHCLETGVMERPLESVGTVYSFTNVHSKQTITPFAFVDFPEEIRIFGRCEGDQIEIGKQVRVYLKTTEGSNVKLQVFHDV